jgi:hypothetical protein
MSRTSNIFIPAIAAIILLSACVACVQAAPRELNDQEMDRVHGGAGSTETPARTSSETPVAAAEPVAGTQTINMGAGAQQNLTSIVNIMSVNSTVQVLMNINVTVDSQVNTVTQGNTGTQSR